MDEKEFARGLFSLVGNIREKFDIDDRIEIKDISSNSLTILGAIHHSNGVTIKEIAEYMNIKQSNCSRSVASLLKDGYLEKVTAKEDERKVNLYLTEKGVEVVKSHRRQMISKVAEKAKEYPCEKIDTIYTKVKEIEEILDSL